MLPLLITDRTQAQYDAWAEMRDRGIDNMTDIEREQFLIEHPGAYNARDLNRVGTALNYVRDRLTAAGYLGGNEFTAKTNWQIGQIPTAEQFSYYLKAVETIRAAMSRYQTTPPTPEDTGSLDIEGANNIEKILIDVDELITNMLAVRNYCGELCSGEI